MISPSSSSTSQERRLVITWAVLFSVLAWAAVIDAVFDLI